LGRTKIILFVLLATFSWLLGVFSEIESFRTILGDYFDSFNSLMFSFFIVFVFLFYRSEIEASKKIADLLELLWKGFITALSAFGIVLLVRITEFGANSNFTISIFEHLGSHFYVAVIIVFQANVFYIFKNLSVFPKVKAIERQWFVLEILLITLLFFSTFFPTNNTIAKLVSIGATFLITMTFAVRLKWIVYLDFKQKVQAALLITSVILMGLFFLQLYLGGNIAEKEASSFFNNLFFYAQFTFFGVYSVFSVLMIFFNMPASSVFDKKMEEMARFQKFSETMQQNADGNRVLDQLLDGAIALSMADAAWLEYYDKDKKNQVLVRNIESSDVSGFRSIVLKTQKNSRNEEFVLRDLAFESKHKALSVFSIPIMTSNNNYGFVVLLKYVKDGFEKDILSVVRTYTHQAAISLENMTLMSDAIEKERYLEEIKISKRIQKSLLPKYNFRNEVLDISFYSKSTGTVGGDFYDFCTSDGIHYWIAIGDVAGKGTSAAFLMAQLKGIFRSLVQVCSGPRNLVVRANNALAYSTEKAAFITLSVFLVDTEGKFFRHTRAGHCQAILVQGSTGNLLVLEPKGMGLGMLKDDSYRNFIEEENTPYQIGDCLFLFTDGVTEARNPSGELFGIERLKNFLALNYQSSTDTITDSFGNYLRQFCAELEEDDDVTFLAIRFA
jgi:sigma-B regulation protein RsbU (phosphoserine phosphatase)